MATKKDLVEAHSFSRRRLVTAFLSGAPGGREVEPSRPGRTIVGGIALSVLLIAGAAIASVLAARTPADWNKPGIIRSQGDDALYVILKTEKKPVLRPIANVTSAQLIFGADAPRTAVAADTINEQIPGPTIGIFGAPPVLPTTGNMIQTGWSACTGANLGIQVDVSREAQVQSGTGYAFTVRTNEDNKYYLVTTGADDGGPQRARSYEIPDNPAVDQMLLDLGVKQRREALAVPREWVDLFETGGALDFSSFGFDASAPAPAAARAAGLKVGDFTVVQTGSAALATGLVVTPTGLLPLTPFALAVYRNSILPGTSSRPTPLPQGTTFPPALLGADQTDTQADFPVARPSRGTPTGQACAVLTTEGGERPAVRLGVDPMGSASAASVVTSTDRVVSVDPGKGAFFYTGTFEESVSDTRFVLNSQGNVYSLVDVESVEKLGYDKLKGDPPLVPDQWNELFVEGVPLSTTAALCPPDPTREADKAAEAGEVEKDKDQVCETAETDSVTAGATG